MAEVLKRKGHTEEFDDRKLFRSVYEACVSAQMDPEEAQEFSEDIVESVEDWMSGKENIGSEELRESVCRILAEEDPEISFFYDQHVPNLKRL